MNRPNPPPHRLVYSYSSTTNKALAKRTVFLDPEHVALADQLIEDGLVGSVPQMVRLLLAAATGLGTPETMHSFHSKALEIQRTHPGMTYREACAELGRRSGAKRTAAAAREERQREKVARYQAAQAKRLGDREDAP